jgi:hypothetical protein
MGRAGRTSSIIEKASIRLNNLKSISPTLDLGPGLTVAAFEQLIGNTQAALDDYNQPIAALDACGVRPLLEHYSQACEFQV